MAYVWLSHILNNDTPAYGGGTGFSVTTDKDIDKGDSCNTVTLQLSNHIGSHVDAPKHFVSKGMCIDEYKAEEWVFNKPIFIDVSSSDADIIDANIIESYLDDSIKDADFVMIQTGAEKYRFEQRYWQASPAFSPDISEFLISRFPSFKAIGIDTISISSYAHRELGREAHKQFLGSGIRIFEDLSFCEISSFTNIKKVIALPLRFSNADGAPTTLIGEV